MSKKMMKAFFEFMKSYDVGHSDDVTADDDATHSSNHDEPYDDQHEDSATCSDLEEDLGDKHVSLPCTSSEVLKSDVLEDLNDEKKGEMALSTDRKTNTLKRTFRHIMKKSAIEAGVWGKKSLKHLESKELKWIHDRILSQCPFLKGKEKKVDVILGKALIEAKHYRNKVEKRTFKKKSKKKKKKQKHQGSSSSSDEEKHMSSNTRSRKHKESKHFKKKSVQQKKQGSRKTYPHLSKSVSLEKVKEVEEKQKLHDEDTSSSEDDRDTFQQDFTKSSHSEEDIIEQDIGSYEASSVANRQGVKAIMKTIKESSSNETASEKFTTGESVIIEHKRLKLATATYVSSVDGMYANLIFEVFLNEASSEIELPSPVPKNVQSGRQEKLHLNELEKGDIFTWKIEKLSLNAPTTAKSGGRYVYGVIAKKDIFKEIPDLSHSKRPRKPNSKYL